jgi:NADPH dehydrogenase (quinone)
MKILSINTHLTYPGWSEGKLNLAFMDLAKAFFVERGHQVAETFVERGYDPEEEVKKHAEADLVILQTPVNWFSAPWIYKKYVDEVFNVGLAKEVLLAGDGRTRPDPSRHPDIPRALEATSGIWRNTACDLKFCFLANIA